MCHASCVLSVGCALRRFSRAVAKAVSDLDGWYRSGLGYSASADRIHPGLAGFSGHLLFWRGSEFLRLGNIDVRTQYRMGRLKTSSADGMGHARMDVGISAHQLVVTVDGVDQC